MCNFDNSNEHDNIDESVPIYIATHFLVSVQFPRYIYLKLFITPSESEVEKVIFTMWADRSLGYRYHKTIHSSSRHLNCHDESPEEEVMGVSLGEEICGHRSIDTSHSS